MPYNMDGGYGRYDTKKIIEYKIRLLTEQTLLKTLTYRDCNHVSFSVPQGGFMSNFKTVYQNEHQSPFSGLQEGTKWISNFNPYFLGM